MQGYSIRRNYLHEKYIDLKLTLSLKIDSMSKTNSFRINRLIPLIYLIILGAIWGLHFSLMKLIAESGISYRGIAAVTTAGVAFALLLIAVSRRRFPVWNRHHLKFYFICALIGYVVPFFIELYAAANLPASVLSIIGSNSPIFTVLIAMAIRSDTVSSRTVISILFGVLSALVILVPASIGVSDVSAKWILVALSIPLIYAVYHNYVSKAWPRESDSFQVACGEALIALLILLPIYILKGDFSELQTHIDYGYLIIGLMVILAIIEIFLYFEIVRLSGPIFVSQASYVTVFAGVIWGMVIFNESISMWVVLSAVFLGLSLYFISTKKNQGHSVC